MRSAEPPPPGDRAGIEHLGEGERGLPARSIASLALSLVMIAVGVRLIVSFFLAGRLDGTATNGDDPGGFNVPKLKITDDGSTTGAAGPKDKTLELTVPAMARIENDEIPTAVGTDEEALQTNAAIHLEGTGFPWQREANVYIAGHRLGFPNTESWLTFWDLDEVDVSDEIFIADATGTEYTYKVFREFTVGPSNGSVTAVKPGKNILTLQTCTPPDYSQRLIVQAELVEETEADGSGAEEVRG